MKNLGYIIITILTLFVLFFSVPVASAHRPEDGNQNGLTVIPDPNTSFAYYREINAPDEVHVYAVDVQAGQFFHAGINIPQLDGLKDYAVTMALIGPGLPKLDAQALPINLASKHLHQDHHSENAHVDDHNHQDSQTDDIEHSNQTAHDHANEVASLVWMGVQVPATHGVIIESNRSDVFYEPFTQTSYWGRQNLDLTLPETGRYYLVIWNPNGERGKYVLDSGKDEVFSPTDIFRFPIWWIETRAYFGQTSSLIAVLTVGVLLISLVAGTIIFRNRRKAIPIPVNRKDRSPQ